MAQNGNIFTAFWMDTSTAPGTPLTGLSATIKIKESPGGAIVVNNVAMTDVGDGWYEYVFTGYNPAKDYTYTCNPGAIAYIDSGVTDNLQQLISEVRVGGGGGGNYSQTIQTAISNAKTALEKKIEEEHNKTRQVVIDGDSETNSHIELAKGEINDKIESIEIPEAKLEEKEAKKAIKLIQGMDKKLTGYIESEMKEKDDIKEISSEFLKLEKEEREREIKEKEEERLKEIEDKKKEEEEKKMEAERDAKLLEELQAEFDKSDEEDKLEKKKELEAEIKEMEKEMKEKEKELNSI